MAPPQCSQARRPEPGSARILLLSTATSYRVAAYRDAAVQLGLDLLVACEGEQALVSSRLSGLRLDLRDRGAALATLRREHRLRPFRAVVSTDDAMVELAVRVAEILDLPHNPLAAARRTRRKDLARRCLAAASLPVPRFRTLDLNSPLSQQLAGVDYPCVIKPVAMSASRGVIRADDEAEALAACRRVAAIVASAPDAEERHTLLLEDFLPGTEVAVEGLLRGGVLDVLAVFDKPDPLEGPFFEETYYITPSTLSEDTQSRIREHVAEAARAYGLVEGPVHAELRVHADEVRIIEMAARTIGGDCARLLKFGTGDSLEALILGHAAGLPVSTRRPSGAAGVLMIPTKRAGTLRRVEGVLEARTVPYVDDVVISVREGYELVPLPEGASYLGFVFASGPDARTVEQALRRAHECLKVVVAPMWKLEPIV